MDVKAIVDAGAMLLQALTTNSLLGWTIVIVILSVGVYAMVHILAVRQYASSELNRIRATAREIEELALISAPITDEEAIERISALPNGATRSVLAALQSMKRFPNPSVATVMTVVSQQEMDRLSRFRTIPNNLMMLGLFGTVLGLAGVIGTLGPQVSSALSVADPAQLAAALGLTLSEMQTAFSCTIYGVMLSISVATLLSSATRSQAKLLEEVESLTVHKFAPALLPKSYEFQIAELRDVLRFSHQFLTSYKTSIRESAESFRTVLLAAGETTRQSIEGLNDSTESMSKLLERITDSVVQSSTALRASGEVLSREGSALVAASTSLSDRLDRFESVLVEEREATGKERKEELDRLARMSSSIVAQLKATQDAFAATLERSLELADESHQALGSALQEQSLTSKGLEEAMGRLTEAMASSSQSLAVDIAEMRRLQEVATQHQEALARHSQGVNQGLASLPTISNLLSNSQAREDARWDGLFNKLNVIATGMDRSGGNGVNSPGPRLASDETRPLTSLTLTQEAEIGRGHESEDGGLT